MQHEESSPLRNTRVMVVAKHPFFQHEQNEAEMYIEDWWDRITGGSWMEANGNPAAIHYAMRAGVSGLPIDDDVLYGKDMRGMGHIIHLSEIQGVPEPVREATAITRVPGGVVNNYPPYDNRAIGNPVDPELEDRKI